MLSQLPPLILLRKCVCPSTHAPLGMIPVVGKLGSYSNVQHKKYDMIGVGLKFLHLLYSEYPLRTLHGPQVLCHMLNLTSTFGGGPQSSYLVDGVDSISVHTLMGNISEISSPRIQSSGKIYSSELWASKQAHHDAPKSPCPRTCQK